VELLPILGLIFSAIFWMYIGWRAMLAHERIAAAMEQLARRLGPPFTP
jgi:hypothetical protein